MAELDISSHNAHVPPDAPYPPSLPSTIIEPKLDDYDDRIATELTSLPPAHHRDSVVDKDGNWTWRPQLVRAETAEEQQEEAEHRRLGLRYRKYQLVKAEVKWYDGFLSWWGKEVSVKIDIQGRRDHLGMFCSYLCYGEEYTDAADCHSTRANLSGLPAHICCACDGGSDGCAVVPFAAYVRSQSTIWILCSRHAACCLLHHSRYTGVIAWSCEVLATTACDRAREGLGWRLGDQFGHDTECSGLFSHDKSSEFAWMY